MNRAYVIEMLMEGWVDNADEDTIRYYKDSQMEFYNSLSDHELKTKYEHLIEIAGTYHKQRLMKIIRSINPDYPLGAGMIAEIKHHQQALENLGL